MSSPGGRVFAWLGGAALAALFFVDLVQGLVSAWGWWTLSLGVSVVLAAAGVWFGFRANKIRQIRRAVEVAVVDVLSPAEFERHIAALLTRDGCLQVRVVGGRGDGGVDVLARTPGMARIAVQCKHYPGRAVGPSAVRDFNGCAWTDHGADVALLVTSGRFTSAAADFGRRHRIQMVDRELLARWMVGEQILPGIRAPWRRRTDALPASEEAPR